MNKATAGVSYGRVKEQTLADVLTFPILPIEERKITQKTAEHFGVRTELSSSDGRTPIAHYFPYTIEDRIVGYKKRDLTKPKQGNFHFTSIGYHGVKCDLFGLVSGNKTGGKKVFVSEGEIDCMLMWQCLKEGYKGKGNPTTLSIGCGTANAVQNLGQKANTRYLNKFSEKVFAFDNDSATPQERLKKIKRGNEATADVYGLFPDMLVAKLPEDSDPCDVYLKEGSTALYWMLMKPSQYTPEGFTLYEEIREETHKLPVVGKTWPWRSLTRLTLGRRLGEGYYFGAGVKQGKSCLADKLISHILARDKNSLGKPQKVAVFKFEEPTTETIHRVAGKESKKDFTNPEKAIFFNEKGEEVVLYVDDCGEFQEKAPPVDRSNYFTQEDLIAASDKTGPRLCLYNNYGRCSWDELKGAIRHAVLIEHCEDIIIDPITRLTTGMTPSEANTELDRFADEISKMSIDLGFTYYCFCHLKAPDKGQPHEFGGKVYSSQFTGSRSMMR